MFKKQISKEEWEKNKKELQDLADKYDNHEKTVDPKDAKMDHNQLSQSLNYSKGKKKPQERKADDSNPEGKNAKNPLSKSGSHIPEHSRSSDLGKTDQGVDKETDIRPGRKAGK